MAAATRHQLTPQESWHPPSVLGLSPKLPRAGTRNHVKAIVNGGVDGNQALSCFG